MKEFGDKNMLSLLRLCYNRDMKKRVGARGFTLIELSLSLIFIAILSVSIVLLIQNTTVSYRRGLILNEVNTVGMDLVDDMRMSVQNASTYSVVEMCKTFYPEPNKKDDSKAPRNMCINDNANSFVQVTKKATVKVKDGDDPEETYKDMPVYGAFCTGTYTYIWNSGYFESSDYSKRQVIAEGKELGPVALAIKGKTENLAENFRLLKIYDAERTVCVNAMEAQDTSAAKNKYIDEYSQNRIGKQFEIDQSMVNADLDHEGGVELMSIGELNDLVLYDLYVAKPALSATRENLFYSVAFILGTRRGGINITRAGDSCKPPSDEYSELEYCAINKFNFAVEAGGQ